MGLLCRALKYGPLFCMSFVMVSCCGFTVLRNSGPMLGDHGIYMEAELKTRRLGAAPLLGMSQHPNLTWGLQNLGRQKTSDNSQKNSSHNHPGSGSVQRIPASTMGSSKARPQVNDLTSPFRPLTLRVCEAWTSAVHTASKTTAPRNGRVSARSARFCDPASIIQS